MADAVKPPKTDAPAASERPRAQPGQGFFTSTGELKSKAALASEASTDTAAVKQTIQSRANDPISALTSSDAQDRDPFREVEGRARDQINSALNQTAEAEDQLKRAQSIVVEQRKILKQAKSALADGASDEKIEKLATRYNELQSQREELRDEITSSNRARSEEGRAAIQVGSKGYGFYGPKSIDLQSGPEVDFSSEKSVKQALQVTRDDVKDVRAQQRENRSERQRIQAAGTAAIGEITGIREKTGVSAIRDPEVADAVSKLVSGAIRDAGASAVDVYQQARTSTATTILEGL